MARIPTSDLLRRAAREHRRLERLAATVRESDPEAVLQLGAAVVLHGLVEELHLFALHRLLDPSVRDELRAEHDRIEETLSLLEELLAEPVPSDDLAALTAALARRLREHVERDGRVLYPTLERMDLLGT